MSDEGAYDTTRGKDVWEPSDSEDSALHFYMGPHLSPASKLSYIEANRNGVSDKDKAAMMAKRRQGGPAAKPAAAAAGAGAGDGGTARGAGENGKKKTGKAKRRESDDMDGFSVKKVMVVVYERATTTVVDVCFHGHELYFV